MNTDHSIRMNSPDDASAKRRRGRPRKHSEPHSVGVAKTVSNEADNSMVGKAVLGAIEDVFDAGYFLTVRVADSSTMLRGIVFRPGHFVPVSAKNDLAPNVKMIRRNEIPVPTKRYDPKAVLVTRASHMEASKGKWPRGEESDRTSSKSIERVEFSNDIC